MTGTLNHDPQTYTEKRIAKNLLANAEYRKAFMEEILLHMDSDNKKFEKSSK
jgi:GT2 family glycosyltransferase